MMRDDGDRTAAEWFALARRAFLAAHQGCPRCAAQHCVFRSRWGQRVEYHCTTCDFSTGHDDATDWYSADLGETVGFAPGCLVGEVDEAVVLSASAPALRWSVS